MSQQSDLYFALKARAQQSSDKHNEERNQAAQPLSFEDRCAICAIITYGGLVGWMDEDGVGHEIGPWEEGMEWSRTGYYRLVWPMGGNMMSHPVPLPWIAEESKKTAEEIAAQLWHANSTGGAQ